jgi:hypothetical protein
MSNRGKRWDSESMDSCHIEERGPLEEQSIPDPPPLKIDQLGGGSEKHHESSINAPAPGP